MDRPDPICKVYTGNGRKISRPAGNFTQIENNLESWITVTPFRRSWDSQSKSSLRVAVQNPDTDTVLGPSWARVGNAEYEVMQSCEIRIDITRRFPLPKALRRRLRELKKESREAVKFSELPADLNKIPQWVISLAIGRVPDELREYEARVSDLLENYVFLMFKDIFRLRGELWGNVKRRYEPGPDGYVVVDDERRSCLFDTKSAEDGYNPSKEIDTLGRCARDARPIVKARSNTDADFTLIVSSEFKGRNENQATRFSLACESRAKLILCKAVDLAFFAVEIRKIEVPQDITKLVRWARMFSKANPVLTEAIFREELEQVRKDIALSS